MNIFLGGIFIRGTDEMQSTFKYAFHLHNINESSNYKIDPIIDIVDSDDPFKVAHKSKF